VAADLENNAQRLVLGKPSILVIRPFVVVIITFVRLLIMIRLRTVHTCPVVRRTRGQTVNERSPDHRRLTCAHERHINDNR